MDKRAEVKDALKRMMQGEVVTTLTLAQVIGVDEGEATCDVQDQFGVEIYDVRLASVSGVVGFLLVPTVDSWVLIGDIGNSSSEYVVLHVDQISKIKVLAGEATFEADSDGIKLQVGAVDLKGVLSDLVTAIKLITVTTPSGTSGTPLNFASFNTVQTKINQLLK